MEFGDLQPDEFCVSAGRMLVSLGRVELRLEELVHAASEVLDADVLQRWNIQRYRNTRDSIARLLLFRQAMYEAKFVLKGDEFERFIADLDKLFKFRGALCNNPVYRASPDHNWTVLLRRNPEALGAKAEALGEDTVRASVALLAPLHQFLEDIAAGFGLSFTC